MKRILLIGLIVSALGAFVVVSVAANGQEDAGGGEYVVELDNAFGLIEGADVKVAGVRAGQITSMDLDRDRFYARVGIRIDQQGFGDLRRDVECVTKPQSLIGEYFVDCKPGTSPEKLPKGATIPVAQTGSTVPVDLVNNIMRRPYRERFSILLSELGAALAARGPDLNETIRRAVPALRETDRLLAVLAEQRTVIRDLYEDADTVLLKLADGRDNVVSFVEEARDTARTSATRRAELRGQFQRFPTFLSQLRPTLKLLGQASDRQVPALNNLRASADLLERFLLTLGPFAEASRPAFRTLAAAARQGRGAVRAARPQIAELRRGVEPLPEAAGNLAITLKHLDDPKNASEKDARSGRPDGGFTGLEAVLRYFYAQSQAVNLFDANSYVLKVNAFLDRQCATYTDETTVKAPGNERCLAWLGPNQPGINQPDPTAATSGGDQGDSGGANEGPNSSPLPPPLTGTPALPRTAGPGGVGSRQSAAPGLPALPRVPALPDVPNVPGAPRAPSIPQPPAGPAGDGLLDFLLGG